MAEFVKIFVVFPQMFSVLFWRNDRRHALVNSFEDDFICIIASICQKIFRLESFNQLCCNCAIRCGTRSEKESHRHTIRILVTEGTRADCKEAVHLIEGISAETLLANRGYDTNEILSYVVSAGMESVIPPKKNRKEQRDYDKYLYKLRHLVENCFLSLKRWRGIATRYAKTSDAFIAAVHVRCIAIWAAIRT